MRPRRPFRKPDRRFIGSFRVQCIKDHRDFVYKDKETNLDFSGIAKGYAVDEIVETLEELGLANFL